MNNFGYWSLTSFCMKSREQERRRGAVVATVTWQQFACLPHRRAPFGQLRAASRVWTRRHLRGPLVKVLAHLETSCSPFKMPAPVAVFFFSSFAHRRPSLVVGEIHRCCSSSTNSFLHQSRLLLAPLSGPVAPFLIVGIGCTRRSHRGSPPWPP